MVSRWFLANYGTSGGGRCWKTNRRDSETGRVSSERRVTYLVPNNLTLAKPGRFPKRDSRRRRRARARRALCEHVRIQEVMSVESEIRASDGHGDTNHSVGGSRGGAGPGPGRGITPTTAMHSGGCEMEDGQLVSLRINPRNDLVHVWVVYELRAMGTHETVCTTSADVI